MKRDEATRLNRALGDAIGAALSKFVEDGEAAGKSEAPIAKRCDHKFLGSNNCAKCGASVESLGGVVAPVAPPQSSDDFDKLYRKIKAKLLEDLRVDPTFVKLLGSLPEVALEIEPRRVTLEGSSLKGRVCRLVADGFLDGDRTQGEIIRELKRTGTEPASNRMSEALQALLIDGILTREAEGWRRAPGVKVTRTELQA